MRTERAEADRPVGSSDSPTDRSSLEYAFEAGSRTSFRDKQRAVQEKTKLTRRLGFSRPPPAAVDGRLLELAVHCHLAIDWYQRRLREEVRARRRYFFLSLTLLAVIPALLYLLVPQASEGHAAAVVTAQLSAVVTGLLAFQRGVSAWLDKRQVVGGYSRAASQLKTILYSFEQTWEGHAEDAGHAAEFVAAIKDAIQRCREVVRVETDSYFQTLSYPSLDLGSLVRTSSLDAGRLLPTFVPDAISDVERASARLDQLRRKVAELDERLASIYVSKSVDA